MRGGLCYGRKPPRLENPSLSQGTIVTPALCSRERRCLCLSRLLVIPKSLKRESIIKTVNASLEKYANMREIHGGLPSVF